MKINSTKTRSQFNLFRVLRQIWLNHGISRIDLCQLLDIDKATMSSITGHLMVLGIIEEVAPSAVKVQPGRRPVGLGIISDFGFIIGVEFHRNGIRAVAKDMRSRTIINREFPKKIERENIKSSFFEAYNEISRLLDGKRILGVGVAVSGIVNYEKGIIFHSKTLGVTDEPYNFDSEVFQDLTIPGFIDNDANCCARGILSDHRSEEFTNFLYAHINYEPLGKYQSLAESLGLGFGIVLNGKLYCGPHYTAGEFQSINFDPDRINQLDLNEDELRRYVTDRGIQKKVFSELSKHLALFVNVFNFQNIFMGGDLPPLLPSLKVDIQNAIDENWLYPNKRECPVHLVSKEKMSPSLGAAGMFLDLLFTVPEMEHSRGALIWEKFFGDQLLNY